MTRKPTLNVTVSGSFRRAMSAVQDAVYRLTDAGALVLSPADPRVVDEFGEFLFVASDRVRAIRLVQSRHLAAIKASDLLWLVAPAGYVGQSAAMEIGYAVAVGTPVFASEVPLDLTMRQYVTPLRHPEDALRAVRQQATRKSAIRANRHVLLDPESTIEAAHDDLERIAVELSGAGEPANTRVVEAAGRLEASVARPLRHL